MLTATIGTALLLSQAVLGGHGHHSARLEACDECGSKDRVVIESLLKLQTSPRWRERDDAANDLRDVDWRLHPEVVEALSFALLNDPEEEVREEAAESLTKLAPCHPVARAALARAAECDRDYATRHWARKGLKAAGKSCKKGCDVCEIGGGAGDELIVPGPGLGPEPGLIPGETILRGGPLVPGQPLLGPGFDSGLEPGMIPPPPPSPSGATIPLESIPLVPPAEPGPVETSPSPLPIPQLESSDDSVEPLPLEAPAPAAAAASEKPAKLEETKMVKPVKHEETKRVAQGRKRSLSRILRFPVSLFDR